MRRCKLAILFILSFSFFSFFARGQGNIPENTTDTLAIGIKTSPPFIYQDEAGAYRGISIWLWEQLAEELGYVFQYREMSLEEIILNLERDSIDLSINPLTVTSERIERIDFTQPFFVSSSAVAAPKSSELSVGLAFLRKFFSLNFLKAVLLLFLVIFVFGFVAWLFERHKNPDEFPTSWRGLWEGIWWSAVTMTTVGYGDKSPKSAGGRVIGLVWMFTAIIIISGFTASIASSLTVNQLGGDISSLSELRNRKVGSIAASASESFLKNNFINARAYDNLETGLGALQKQEVEAFVYDEPILRYTILRDSLEGQVEVLPFLFNPQYYSFGLPKGSPLEEALNPILLRITESNRWRVILSEYELREF
ncbi:MAG: transporter substrate-binding domain-containing protein [Phaeodactylibacter sp.]|nr:transporter substrate-binding domain-containing protein [Phaeodactylibacter sp.]